MRPRDRVGSRVAGNGGRARVTRAAGLGHAGGGIPPVALAPGSAWTRPESVGDGAGAGVKNLLHHIIGWEQSPAEMEQLKNVHDKVSGRL